MENQNNDKHDQLLIQIITMFTQQAWVAMGKLKNPVTDKLERKLDEATFYIDVIEMMKIKMNGNLNLELNKFIESSLNNLKMNYLEETKKSDKEDNNQSDEKINDEKINDEKINDEKINESK